MCYHIVMAEYLRQPPSPEDAERLVGAQHDLSVRVSNLRPFYDAIEDRDRALHRRDRDLERANNEIDRLKNRVSELERELRARPRSPEQLRGIVARSEQRAEAITSAWAQAQEIAEAAGKLALELESASQAELRD